MGYRSLSKIIIKNLSSHSIDADGLPLFVADARPLKITDGYSGADRSKISRHY